MGRFKRYNLIIFLILFTNFICAQKITLIETCKTSDYEVSFFNIEYIDSCLYSIEFAQIGELKNGKPTLIYFEGSGLTPSFIKDSTNEVFYTSFQSILSFSDSFNLIIPSKFGIPICTTLDYLNENYEYFENQKLPESYLMNSTLENYTNIFNRMINSLSKKAKNKHFFVMGHSQGARIALSLMTNKYIMSGIYMSADPLGRLASTIDEEFSRFENRNIEKCRFYLSLLNCSDCPVDSVFRNESIQSWKSFSKPSILLMNDLSKPLLITYGDMDLSCPNCYIFDILPHFNKSITVKKYEGYDHNYFFKNEKKIELVYDEIKNWLLQQKSR